MKSVTLNVLILFGLIFSINQSIAGNGNIKTNIDFSSIEMIGSSVAPFDWSSGVDMQTSDGIVYTLRNYVLPSGKVKFRQDHSWTINWGNFIFPAAQDSKMALIYLY